MRCRRYASCLCVAVSAVVLSLSGSLHASTVLQGFTDDTLYPGDSALLVWFISESQNPKREWIGIYEAGANNRNPLYWEYLPHGVRFGTIRFYLDEPGVYEARFFANETRQEIAERKVLTVLPDEGPDGGGTDYRLDVERRRGLEGLTLYVDWRIPLSQQSKEHWIGIFDADEYMWSRSYDWKYLPDDEYTGVMGFEVLDEGRYELRLYQDRYKELKARSRVVEVERYQDVRREYELDFDDRTVRVGDRVTVEWEVPDGFASERDWIGLRRTGSSRTTYEDWAYLNSERDRGEVDLRASEPGEYEAILYSSGSYIELVRTEGSLIVRE